MQNQRYGHNHGSIGVFDSGFGGLSVAMAICERLPNEAITYIADTAYTPYGDLPSEAVTQRTVAMAQALTDLGAKAIVVACNTATAAAIAQLRTQFQVPIIGVEPGVKPALAAVCSADPGSSVIAVLATNNTLRAERFKALVAQHAGNHPVVLQPCPGFVDIVEQGAAQTPEATKIVDRVITPLIDQGIRIFVLGCTHYFFLANTIREVAKVPITLVETSQAVARQLDSQLTLLGLKQPEQHQPSLSFYCTKLTPQARTCLKNLWPSSHSADLETLPKVYYS